MLSFQPRSEPLTAAALPNAGPSALTRPSPSPFEPLDRVQISSAVTNAPFAALETTPVPPIGRSLDTTDPLLAGSSLSITPISAASNIAWPFAHSSKSVSFTPTRALDDIQSQCLDLHTYPIDPYKIELEFRALATRFPAVYETLVGLYLQDSGRTPGQIGQNVAHSLSCRGWEPDLRRQDVLNTAPNVAIDRWVVPNDPRFLANAAKVGRYTAPFEASICWFAVERDVSGLTMEHIIRKAGWTTWAETVESMPFRIVHTIFIMDEGEEKERRMAQAKQESPLFFGYCLKDPFCGTYVCTWWRAGARQAYRILKFDLFDIVLLLFLLTLTTFGDRRVSVKKRKRVNQDTKEVTSYTPGGPRVLVVESEPKRIKMAAARPMQVHNVPLEERAFDSKGNRLPWALEWPE